MNKKIIWRKARKKPVIVEFREVNGKVELIKTREGELFAIADQDYIIRGVEGEIYPIKKEIFDKTYEIIKDESEWKPDYSQIMTIEESLAKDKEKKKRTEE